MAPVLAPFQWSLYAAKYPERAVPVINSLMLSYTDLSLVNDDVNKRIKPAPGVPDVLLGWVEDREPAGWCGDYAVTKRALLLRLGCSSAKLLLAHVLTATSENHLVLVVDDQVLDNRVTVIRHRMKTGYKGVAIQTKDNPNFWEDASGMFH